MKKFLGRVIGEFVCDRIDEYAFHNGMNEQIYQITDKDLAQTCLDYDDIEDYGKSKPLYAWYISDLKIYDKPKELGEFKRECKQYGAENPLCDDCRYYDCCQGLDYDESDCVVDGLIPLKKPFQSWGYVEVSE